MLCLLSEIVLGLVLFFNVPLIQYGAHYYPILEGRPLMWIIRLNILIYLPAVGLGLWFSDGFDIKTKRNAWLWLAAPLSFIYIYAFYFHDFQVQIFDGEYMRRLIWPDYTILVYPYAAFFLLLAMKFLPSTAEGRISGVITRISNSTYHIFLCQILYYAVWFQINPDYLSIGFGSDTFLYIPFYAITVLICFSCGILWHEAERRIGMVFRKRRKKKHQELVTNNR
jgi:hypothetical protein